MGRERKEEGREDRMAECGFSLLFTTVAVSYKLHNNDHMQMNSNSFKF